MSLAFHGIGEHSNTPFHEFHMLSYDFIDAAVKSYKFIWEQKRYLARVCVPVIFLKMLCLLAIFILDVSAQNLTQGIILLPSVVLEAFFVIGLIRYFHYREPIFTWGKLIIPPRSDDHPTYAYHGPYNTKQSYLGGILTYLLIKVIQIAFVGFIHDNKDMVIPQPPTAADSNLFLDTFVMFAVLTAIAWAFRLIWLYIPIAIGVPYKLFFKAARGMVSSFTMLATWILCSMPLFFLIIIASAFTESALPDQSATEIIAMYLVATCIEMIMISVLTIGMTIGIRQIIFGKDKKEHS